MRYRIVIEVDTERKRGWLDELAKAMYDVAVTTKSNPVFLSTELIDNHGSTILIGKD